MTTPEVINLNDNVVSNADSLVKVEPWTPLYDGLVIEKGYDPTTRYGDLFAGHVIAAITPADLAKRLESIYGIQAVAA
mgnify:CR=1 FL=1